MKFLVFTLILANIVLASYLYASETRVVITENTDLNANKLRIVPLKVSSSVEKITAVAGSDNPKMICLQWSGIAGNELQQAKAFLTPLVPVTNIAETHVEEPSRFWVHIPPSANPTPMLNRLKAAGIKDVSLMQPSNAISLGLFRTEETAARYLEELQDKGFAQVKIEPRRLEIKEATLTVKDVSKELIEKLSEYKKQFDGTTVETIDCNGAEKKSDKASS